MLESLGSLKTGMVCYLEDTLPNEMLLPNIVWVFLYRGTTQLLLVKTIINDIDTTSKRLGDRQEDHVRILRVSHPP